MATCTCGGEIGGYCATGKENTAIAPVSVMTTDSTAAKIGRSMKKCENMSDASLSEVRGQRSEVRGQRSEVRGERSEIRGERAEAEAERGEVSCKRRGV